MTKFYGSSLFYFVLQLLNHAFFFRNVMYTTNNAALQPIQPIALERACKNLKFMDKVFLLLLQMWLSISTLVSLIVNSID